MASRVLFNPPLQLAKRSGVRYTSSFVSEREAVKHHAGASAGTWKKISLFVCGPAILGASINAYNLAVAHINHQKEHPHEFVHYPYMNWRVKDYFWGKNSLFFNPKVNHDATQD